MTKPCPKRTLNLLATDAACTVGVCKHGTFTAPNARYVVYQAPNDPDYDIVKEVWEAKQKDPNFQFKINTGQVDPVAEYNKTVINYMKTLLKQSHDTLKTIRGGPVDAPHVETGARTSANMVSTTPATSDSKKLVSDLKEKTDKGHIMSESEEMGLIDAIFGSKDPL